MQRLKMLALLALSACGWKTYAQQNESSLDPVTITASMQPVNSSKTGRNIAVINGEEFSKLPVHSIDELLRFVPGVEIQQRGPMGSQSDIVLRGATFGQVLVILDGERLNDPNTGHFSSYIPIAPTEIDRIEVLKGASSAIYGSEAVGGVINIITKSFAAKKLQAIRQFSAEGTVGEYNLVNANIGGFLQQKNTAVAFGLLSNNSDGQLQRGARGYFNNHTASLSIHQFINNNWSVAFRTAYDDRKFSAQNFYTSFVSDTAEELVKTFWNQANLQYQKANNKLNLDLGYKQAKDNYAFNSGIKPNRNTSRLFQSTLSWQHSINSSSSVIAGSQFQNKTIRSNDRGNHDVKQIAIFVLLNQKLFDNLVLAPAVRLDHDERAGTELVPQVNVSYHFNQLQLRGSAGKTIRQADFTERFNNYNKTFVSNGSIGNPGLEAERSFTFEAGADYFLKSILKISSTVFRRNQKNVIDWINTPYSEMPRKDNLSPVGTFALATNVAAVHTTGIETDLQFTKKLTGGQELWSLLGLIWLDTKTSEPTPSFYISSHAKFLANLSLNYQWKGLGFNVTAIYKKRNPMSATAINVKLDDQCFMMNMKVDYAIIQNRLGTFIEADNLFNNHCRDLVSSLRPSRWIMGGIKLNISK